MAFGLTEAAWTAIEAIAVTISVVILVATVLLAYRQIRQATRSGQFQAFERMQQAITETRRDRQELFGGLSPDLVLSPTQFPPKPPHRHRRFRLSEEEQRAMALTEAQELALSSCTSQQLESAKRVVAMLNDLGQLVEDGYIRKDVFFGKHHLLILRCCALFEAIRRREEKAEGGNYGQRLLRIRARAARYNDLIPKHRAVEVYARVAGERVFVYRSPEASRRKRLKWAVARWFHVY